MSDLECAYIDRSVTEMITAVQFLSSIFTVSKPDGCRRFVLNLKTLNQFLVELHLKMEDIRIAKTLVNKDFHFSTNDQ